jgi:Trm5-related predicted tRNA methylase
MIRLETMRFRQTPEDQEAIEITRLVDEPGESSATGDRPELRRQVEAERRVARELRTEGPAVPDRLVSAIEAKVREAYGPQTETARRKNQRPRTALGGRR